MKLRCKQLDNKKVLIIPSYYEDMFELGKKYDGMTCTRTARYLCLLIPSYRWDEFEDGKEYEVILTLEKRD